MVKYGLRHMLLKIKENMVLFLVALLRCIFYLNTQAVLLTPDSYEFMNVSLENIFRGHLDMRRVPIYPIILQTIRRLYTIILGEVQGVGWIRAVVIFQILCSFGAIILFRRSLQLIISNKKIADICTLFYGCTPIIMGYDKVILTESLSLTGTVCFLYLMVLYLHDKTLKKGLQACVLAGTLPFLRPTFLIYPIILIVFFLWRFIIYCDERKIIMQCGKILTVFSLIILIYAGRMYTLYGEITLSCTLSQQNVILTIWNGLWEYANDDKNQQVKEYISGCLENNPEYNLMQLGIDTGAEFGDENLKEYVKDCKKNGRKAYLSYYVKLLKDLTPVELARNAYYGMSLATNDSLVVDYSPSYYPYKQNNNSMLIRDSLEKIFPNLAFIHVYILLIVELVAVLIGFFKKKILWLQMGLFSFVLAMLLGSIVGTYAEWGRTAITVLPFCWMMIADDLNFFVRDKSRCMMKLVD